MAARDARDRHLSLTTDPSRPDPAHGVFETLLVAEGLPIELDAHLDRLERSASALYGTALPAGVRELALDRARDLPLGRLRLTAVPGADGEPALDAVAKAIEPRIPFPSWEDGAVLAGVVVEGGLGRHKWADRRLLERAATESPAAVPLVVDGDGTVLEASRANVFVVRDGTLATPPADGRILSGVTRSRVAEVARHNGIALREQSLSTDDLMRADEVFLTGSVRGVEPVRQLGGARSWPRGPVTARIAAGLRELWLGRA